MPADVDVLSKLPLASWRGIRFPVMERSCRHAHEVAKTVIQYFGKQLAEIVNGDNLVWEYTIPFRNGVSLSPYRGALFNESLPAFWLAYKDTTPGALVDPIRGEFVALPGSWDEVLDVQRRDGIDVRIMFIEAPVIGAAEGSGFRNTLPGAKADANALDREVQKLPWIQTPSPEPATDPFSAVAGLLTQINSAPGKVAARMQDVSSRCQKIEAALTKLKDPKTSAAPIKAARDLRLKSIHLAQSAASPRLMKTVIVNTRMSVAAAAAETGMSVADLMKLNPALARSPFVNPGATIVAYR